MARTSSLNCLSCRNPYQTPDSLNCLPSFHWKPLFFTEKCFVASPSQKSALTIVLLLCSCCCHYFGGRKLKTNTFISRTFQAKSRDILPKSLVSLGFEGHTELFGPHPFTWKIPTPPENIRTNYCHCYSCMLLSGMLLLICSLAAVAGTWIPLTEPLAHAPSC